MVTLFRTRRASEYLAKAVATLTLAHPAAAGAVHLIVGQEAKHPLRPTGTGPPGPLAKGAMNRITQFHSCRGDVTDDVGGDLSRGAATKPSMAKPGLRPADAPPSAVVASGGLSPLPAAGPAEPRTEPGRKARPHHWPVLASSLARVVGGARQFPSVVAVAEDDATE